MNILEQSNKNENSIENLERELKNRVNSLNIEIRQIRTKNEMDLQQSVRAEMYEQIKSNNIGVTKRMNDMQINVKKQLETNEQVVTEKLNNF